MHKESIWKFFKIHFEKYRRKAAPDETEQCKLMSERIIYWKKEEVKRFDILLRVLIKLFAITPSEACNEGAIFKMKQEYDSRYIYERHVRPIKQWRTNRNIGRINDCRGFCLRISNCCLLILIIIWRDPLQERY